MKLSTEKTVLIVLISVKLLIHFWAILFEGYGVFRDELYYLSCADNLAFGNHLCSDDGLDQSWQALGTARAG